jgi:hypothetical protein
VNGVAGAAHREIQPRLPEQRIGVAPQLTDHGPIRGLIDQHCRAPWALCFEGDLSLPIGPRPHSRIDRVSFSVTPSAFAGSSSWDSVLMHLL